MGKSHQQHSKTDKEYRDHTSTVPWLFAALDAEFQFGIDLAATHLSAKVRTYFTKEMNALTKNWKESVPAGENATGWLNPPYSDILPWIKQARREQQNGFTTVFLVPNDCSGEWWPQGMPCIIRNITGYYYEHVYKSGPKTRKGKSVTKWASGRIEFVNAQTGELMKDPLNKPMCLIIFPAYYCGPTIPESVTKLELMQKGFAWLEQKQQQEAQQQEAA
ncbi:phage N-6-adenine-methyltransferase [Vibrio cholerae]|uniref:phage N-6-adenine-methyltransferase n=1 Tax=Vibrio cholerae TaxID=666 RepID=UPI001C92BCDF|nr:phage N-6-adenine-methyltransferase [Vibrio cholerae]ELJ8564038.1 adenine methyltransferase [Vibrio cholerae]MBY4642209.1 phage N-6-adenine-methyltransferase [Vibrio cholerae]MCR9658481.1 phage N-6-adenine-methyltransferase [Vibrio cholerae]MCR9689163.1 phage N-6-adenine-methyltransferase [Vibrio cholerae]MCR9746494.1 phage N-6-adenine-methyltransferase [Vibrio cholerae]